MKAEQNVVLCEHRWTSRKFSQTKRLKATIGTSNCKICFTQAIIRKAYLPTIDIPENSPDFQHFATICIYYIYNIPQIKSPMLQTYVSWGVVRVCLMDDSKLKEPGSPHWPAKQLRGMRLPSVWFEWQVTICLRFENISGMYQPWSYNCNKNKKNAWCNTQKEKYYKDRRTGCKIELKWNMGSMKRGRFS